GRRIHRALALAAGDNASAALYRFVNPIAHAHGFLFGDHRAEFGILGQRITHFDRLDSRLERVQELTVDLAMHEHALRRYTYLPGVDKSAQLRRVGNLL